MEKIIYYPVFFTAPIRHWKRLLKPEKYKKIIIEQLREQIKKNQLIVYAYCIMDNHIHIIWQVKGDIKTSEVQKQFLEGCSKHIKADLEMNHPDVLHFFKSSQSDREYHFWKRSAKSIELYNDAVFEQKIDYIHHNPLKAGLCNFPEEYQYSSASYYERNDFNDILTHYKG
jgi:putative transposase